jgi:hypothetical protein
MEWLTENFWLVVVQCQQGAFFAALTNPLAIVASIGVLLLGVVWGPRRSALWYGLFAVWFLVPVHYYTVDGAVPEAGNVSGYAAMGLFGFCALIVIGVGFYFFLIKE